MKEEHAKKAHDHEALVVSIGTHIKSRETTAKVMWHVTLALLPAGVAGFFIFGMHSLFLTISAVAAAVVAEIVFIAMRKKAISVFDGSAVLTGLLLAYNIPPGVPLWLPAAGSAFAIIFGKQVFGGLGNNIFNPALIGRAFLMVSWPIYMTTWENPRWQVDAVTKATPLYLEKYGHFDLLKGVTNWDLFLGNRGGCIGEVCIMALLAGAAYLFWKKYITWHTPLTYIATVALTSWAFNGQKGLFTGDALFFVMAGGVVLGAFFMATDYVTGPLTPKGKIVFGAGCGLLTFIIRRFAGYPEGVSYSILIMNAVAPLIDRMTYPKWFGWVEKVTRDK